MRIWRGSTPRAGARVDPVAGVTPLPQYRAALPAPDEEAAEEAASAIAGALGSDAAVSWAEVAKGWLVEAYWDGERPAAAKAVEAVARARGLAAEVGPLPDIDWVAKSLEGLGPVRVGRFVVHGSHDSGAVRANDIGIAIDAAQAFGTGHHGTTAGCIAALARIGKRRRFRSALDLGTGSGVLAFAIAKAWRIPVIATDIDPVAVRIASANARTNGVGSLVHTYRATGFGHRLLRRRFDLIVANILAGPLARLAPEMAAHLSCGGTIVLSGLLPPQRRHILAAYCNQGFRHRRSITRDGWLTLILEK